MLQYRKSSPSLFFKGFVMTSAALLSAIASLGSIHSNSICENDDRKESSFAPVGMVRSRDQLSNPGYCTLTLISDSCALTAGHCLHLIEEAYFFPPNANTGEVVPFAEHKYVADKNSIRALQTRIGNDWAVVRLKANTLTGLLPGKVHGFVEPELTDLSLPEGTLELHATQSSAPKAFERFSASGDILSAENSILFHSLDTAAGSSGSLILNPQSGRAIAIHTHGGCDTMKNNKATIIPRASYLVKAIRACLHSERSR